jgi:hypothetical protein
MEIALELLLLATHLPKPAYNALTTLTAVMLMMEPHLLATRPLRCVFSVLLMPSVLLVVATCPRTFVCNVPLTVIVPKTDSVLATDPLVNVSLVSIPLTVLLTQACLLAILPQESVLSATLTMIVAPVKSDLLVMSQATLVYLV